MLVLAHKKSMKEAEADQGQGYYDQDWNDDIADESVYVIVVQ